MGFADLHNAKMLSSVGRRRRDTGDDAAGRSNAQKMRLRASVRGPLDHGAAIRNKNLIRLTGTLLQANHLSKKLEKIDAAMQKLERCVRFGSASAQH